MISFLKKIFKKKKVPKVTNKVQIVGEKTTLSGLGIGAIVFGITSLENCDVLFNCCKAVTIVGVGLGLLAFKYKLEHNSRWAK